MLNSYDRFLDAHGLDEDQMLAAKELVAEPYTEATDLYVVGPSAIQGQGIIAAMDVDGVVGTFIDGDEWYTLGRYMNHSPTPNCRVEIYNNTLRVRGKAKQGDELCVDYFQVKDMMELRKSIIVVDDFCEDIENVIDSVHQAGFATWNPNKGEVGSSVYDGMAFWGNHALMVRSIVPMVNSVVVPNTMFFRVTNENTEQAYIHSDRETGNWTCVCYMTDHDEPSGTAFYRHKPTGWLEMPSFEDMRDMGVFDQMKEDMVGRDPDKWEQVGYVEGKKNRAVVFYAPLFHSRFPVHGIGKDSKEGRLVWVSHFYKLDGYGRLF